MQSKVFQKSVLDKTKVNSWPWKHISVLSIMSFFWSGWHLNVFESATENTKSVFVLRTGEWENFVVSKMPCVAYSIAHIWVGNLSQKLYTSRGKPIILSDTKATTARFWSVPIGLKNYNWRMSTLRAIFQIFSFHMNEQKKKKKLQPVFNLKQLAMAAECCAKVMYIFKSTRPIQLPPSSWGSRGRQSCICLI